MIKVKNRRINPEKSNKLIWAVAGGLLLLLAALVLLLTWERRPQDRRQLIEQTLGYLRRAEGVIAVTVAVGPDRVTIVYDSHFEARFARIAEAAARRLASRLPDFELCLARNRAQRVVQTIRVAGGRIVAVRDTPAAEQ